MLCCWIFVASLRGAFMPALLRRRFKTVHLYHYSNETFKFSCG